MSFYRACQYDVRYKTKNHQKKDGLSRAALLVLLNRICNFMKVQLFLKKHAWGSSLFDIPRKVKQKNILNSDFCTKQNCSRLLSTEAYRERK